MDEKTVRAQLDEIKASLRSNEEEHAILALLAEGFEKWLQLHATKAPTRPELRSVAPRVQAIAKQAPLLDGKISARRSVLDVIREANGRPLHAREILTRILEMGAKVREVNPLGMVDLMAYSLKSTGHPLEKVGPRTWRWAGEAQAGLPEPPAGEVDREETIEAAAQG